MENQKSITVWKPKVNETQEFIEIAFDFSNPLDLVREAISNSFDANATEILLDFSVIDCMGERVLKIEIEDNGTGMDEIGLHSFFDLGNSLSKNHTDKIGEKGHGTKVYINSNKITVETIQNGIKRTAVMNNPKARLYSGELPEVEIKTEQNEENSSMTKITILGYNNNRTDHFTHDELKDYILWFTKMGSIENQFNINKNENVVLKLKGNDRSDSEGYESISFGHVFPKESDNVDKLFDIYEVNAPNHFCKKWTFSGILKNHTDIKFDAIFYLEGKYVKYGYNHMIKRNGYRAPFGAYSVQERYGLWLCKDFIPVQRKNEWITKKGSEYTKFHAFVNCQNLKLTANRGSVDNTPSEILKDLQDSISDYFFDVINDEAWEAITYLENETDAFNSEKAEINEYKRRIERINRANIAEYNGLRLIEPRHEQGVYSLFIQLSVKEPNLFPFTIIDYDTHIGIDVIVKENNNVPLRQDTLLYVEFKYSLEKSFNHSFKHLKAIVCWDINIKHGEEVEDRSKKKRTLNIVKGENENDYTRYYLNDERSSYKIEIFVLKSFLKEKLNIDFRPRTKDDCF